MLAIFELLVARVAVGEHLFVGTSRFREILLLCSGVNFCASVSRSGAMSHPIFAIRFRETSEEQIAAFSKDQRIRSKLFPKSIVGWLLGHGNLEPPVGGLEHAFHKIVHVHIEGLNLWVGEGYRVREGGLRRAKYPWHGKQPESA